MAPRTTVALASACVVSLAATTACDEEEAVETAVEAPTVDEVTPTVDPAEDPNAIPQAEESQGTSRRPLYATLADEERVPIETVVLEKGEAEGRLLFFRESAECDAVPAEGETEDTVVSVVGLEPENPEWIGAARTSEWWYMQDPDSLEGEGVEVDFSEVDDETAIGTVKVVSTDPARLFRLEGDFSAIVCAPAS